MNARTACAITIVIGAMWAIIGLIYGQPMQDFGLGAAVAGSGALGLGLLEWIEKP